MSMPIITSSDTTRCQAVSDIIESVALQQTGLSHILNAEGEKIQAVLAMATETSDLLEVNKSVESMVNSITRLEVILQGKLNLFKDCICETCDITVDDVTVTLTLKDESVGSLNEIQDKYFIYSTGSTSNAINISTNPVEELTLLTELPDGFKYDNNILYVPSTADIKEIAEISFQVGDDTDCIITIIIPVAM